MDQFARTQLLLGEQGIQKLQNAAVAVFGIGGVGSFTVEALVRSGIGRIAIFDHDRICLTNLNRQLIATHKTVGRRKVEVMRERILEINPGAEAKAYPCFYHPDNADQFDLSEYTYIVDAVDTVTSKLTLIERAEKAGVPIISSMGAGNKLDPSRLEVADLCQTSVCPLARVMRRELKKRGIEHLKVVYSKEPACKPCPDQAAETGEFNRDCLPETERAARRQVPGSVAFVPSAAGLIIAGEVVRDIVGIGE